jgi:hypothetical protein
VVDLTGAIVYVEEAETQLGGCWVGQLDPTPGGHEPAESYRRHVVVAQGRGTVEGRSVPCGQPEFRGGAVSPG